jgi:KUP system potassium uptake protein
MNEEKSKGRRAALSLAALGVVYGDIGTSPLYAFKEVFAGAHHPVPVTPDNVLGVLSMIFWAVMIVVSFKYVILILRADNSGEGGIMALMALVLARQESGGGKKTTVMLLGLFGAALFYGDGVITPAISVLSAVEGIEVVTPAFKPYVIPLTLGILVALFAVQKRGTARVGAFFGPVMVLWFATLTVLGALKIAEEPGVLLAVWPGYGLRFFLAHPLMGFFALGTAFLTLTGAEALYADMGHFGRMPIRLAWFGLVLPALMVNYFGQGALVLRNAEAIQNPFYLLAPGWGLIPLVVLSTLATVIASQAVISGAYSMTRQAMQLGYSPRMEVQHTSSREMGQIYLPAINWTLLASIIILVLTFQSSSNLAAAYGIAVTGTMVITTLFAYLVARSEWQWGMVRASAVFGGLMAVDLAFLSANMLKIHDGGWFPLLFGLAVFTLLTTWKRGRLLLGNRLDSGAMPLADFVASIEQLGAAVVPRTAVFMTTRLDQVPHALLHNLKHNMVVHERIVLATVSVLPIPRVQDSQRVVVEQVSRQIYKVKLFFGFMEEPDVPSTLEWCAEQGLQLNPMETSFFLGRETLLPKIGSEMAFWRGKLFVAMFRNSGSAAGYFKLPPNQVVELGTQVVL